MSRLQTIFLSFLLATTTIFALPNPIPANIKDISPYATTAAPSTSTSTNKQADCERAGVSVPILLNSSTTLEAIALHSMHPPRSNTEPSIESNKVTRLPFTRTSTGREPTHFYTTVLVAHRNSVPCLTGRRRRLGPRRAFIATSIGTFRFDMCLPFCSLPTLQARDNANPMCRSDNCHDTPGDPDSRLMLRYPGEAFLTNIGWNDAARSYQCFKD
jgi:hypothetical protein